MKKLGICLITMLVIDPSTQKLGWARFTKNTIELINCGVCNAPMEKSLDILFRKTQHASICIVEKPNRIDEGIPPMKIVKLGGVVGMVKLLAYQNGMRYLEVNPTQLTKEKTKIRVRQKFPNIDFLLKNVAESYRHNAIDAVHLGMIYGKRFKYNR